MKQQYLRQEQIKRPLQRELALHSALSLVLVVGYIKAKQLPFSSAALSDAFAVLGLFYLVITLLSLVNRLRFFDVTKYGFRKFIRIIFTRDYNSAECQLGTFIDYTTRERSKKSMAGLGIVSVSLLAFSFLLAI